MGQELVRRIIPAVEKTKWEGADHITQLGLQAYHVGLDSADEYQKDPGPLTAALRIFRSGDCLPLAYAGVAYVLVKASHEDEGKYYRSGLEAAMGWLEKAQDMEPDTLHINMIEPLIYIYSDRFEDARTVLDYLEQIAPSDYYLICVEAAYWRQRKFMKETIIWYSKAIEAAETVPQKLRLRSQLGDSYLESGMNEQAVEAFKESTHFSKENPWLWHRLSVAYYRLAQYDEAQRCNKRALALKDFPEAREMELSLQEYLGTGGLTGRLFRRG